MITIKQEISLDCFEFYGGAQYTADYISRLDDLVDYSVWNSIECMIAECCDDDIEDSQLNDFFMYDENAIAEYLGFEDWEALERFVDNDGEEEEED